MFTATHSIASSTQNHEQNAAKAVKTDPSVPNAVNLGALAESLAQKARDGDPKRVARGVNTSVGTILQPTGLGLVCSPKAWAVATAPYTVDVNRYLEEAFFLCCHDDKLSLLCLNIWRHLIGHAEKQQHLITICHRQLQDSFNVSESSIRGSLARLVKEGYIEIREKRYTVDGKVYDLYVSYPKALIPQLQQLIAEQAAVQAAVQAAAQSAAQAAAKVACVPTDLNDNGADSPINNQYARGNKEAQDNKMVLDKSDNQQVHCQKSFLAEAAPASDERSVAEHNNNLDTLESTNPDHVNPDHVNPGHKENLDPPQSYQQNPNEYIYLSWAGTALSLDQAFEQPEAVLLENQLNAHLKDGRLPKKPYEPKTDWIGDTPKEADLATLKGWIDNFERLFMCRKFEEAKQSLAPHQHKLLDWVVWSRTNLHKAPPRYLILLKNLQDEYNISHRRWLEKGDWEVTQESKIYAAAMARLNQPKDMPPAKAPKPNLSSQVAAHIPTKWYDSIENLLMQKSRFVDPKKALELAYHLCYFMPHITYQSEEDRLRINFCVARKHVLAGTWRTPMGLQTQLANRR